MKKRFALAALLLAALPLAAAAPAKKRDESELAKVNGEGITAQDLLDAFTSRHGGHARFLGGDVEARMFLKILIDERLLMQEAYDIGLDQQPAVIGATEEFEQSKASAALINSEIEAKAAPSDAEVRDAWQRLNFFVNAREIVVDTREEAVEVRTAVLHGGDFEALARSCSRAESRVNGGHIRANWGQFDPQWERVVFALEPGEVSPVIETDDGYEVVVVDDRIDAPRPELEKVRSEIQAVLYRRKLEQRKKDFSEFLWQKYHAVPAPIGRSPLTLQRLLATAPETVLVTWNGGGSMTLKQIFNERELRMFALFPPRRAAVQIDAQIRATVNDPLVALEAAERNLRQQPDIADAVHKYRETMMESLLFRDHIYHDVHVTDADVETYYAKHKDAFVEPEQRHVAQILVATEADAQKIRDQLARGADWRDMAAKFSRDFETARSGGDLGWITAAKVPPAFAQILTMGQGAISTPVRSKAGWHIIKVLEIRSQRQQPLDEVRESARTKALDAMQSAAQNFWLQKLRAAAKVEINDAAIKRFVAANKFEGVAPPQHGMK